MKDALQFLISLVLHFDCISVSTQFRHSTRTTQTFVTNKDVEVVWPLLVSFMK